MIHMLALMLLISIAVFSPPECSALSAVLSHGVSWLETRLAHQQQSPARETEHGKPKVLLPIVSH